MASASSNQQRISMFKGDGAHLVDLLVQACSQRPASIRVPVERELVPWVSDSLVSTELEPLESHRRSLPGQLNLPKKHAGSPKRSNKAAASRNRDSYRASRSISPAARTDTAYACPALAASPKPSAVPMPSGLLSRAAVRGANNRCCAGAVMQHLAMPIVYPVAA